MSLDLRWIVSIVSGGKLINNRGTPPHPEGQHNQLACLYFCLLPSDWVSIWAQWFQISALTKDCAEWKLPPDISTGQGWVALGSRPKVRTSDYSTESMMDHFLYMRWCSHSVPCTLYGKSMMSWLYNILPTHNLKVSSLSFIYKIRASTADLSTFTTERGTAPKPQVVDNFKCHWLVFKQDYTLKHLTGFRGYYYIKLCYKDALIYYATSTKVNIKAVRHDYMHQKYKTFQRAIYLFLLE